MVKEGDDMRLWHVDLLPRLDNKRIGGQHVEIRMILGTIKKHGKVNHSTVNYVNDHSLSMLRAYALAVIAERDKRGLKTSPDIRLEYTNDTMAVDLYNRFMKVHILYPEHDNNYMITCIENLKGKGVAI